MLQVNFKVYGNYVTDSVYQWDINQNINIIGLNLASAPEVHFANANMERAIVRQSKLEKDVVVVTIPNSLLQSPLPIKAYIGIYEDETFKVIESLKIPVIAKERPTDYTFEDTDGEIYSYNEILNRLIQLENKLDGVSFDALAEYNALVDKVYHGVTSIENGGTGANNAGEAIKNLGIDNYQKPWNVDENIVSLFDSTIDRVVNITGDSITHVEGHSKGFKMKNSGTVRLSYQVYCYTDHQSISTDSEYGVLLNGRLVGEIHQTTDGTNHIRNHELNMEVKKGDVLSFYANVRQNWSDSETMRDVVITFRNIKLSANWETLYRYTAQELGVATVEDVMNTLLGGNE